VSIHDGHRKRMRQEFLDRPGAFPDHKLLEMLLFYSIPRIDTNPMAHRLIDRFGSLAGVLDALPEELIKTPPVRTQPDGPEKRAEREVRVGESTVVLFKLVKEISARYAVDRSSLNGIITATRDAYRQLRPYFFGAREERVVVLCMDGKGKSLGVRKVAEGSVNAAAIIVRAVVEASLSLNATQVILAHNHVSGLAMPSAEDITTTRYLARVLDSVGVALRDHLIFADDDMVSLRESGIRFLEP